MAALNLVGKVYGQLTVIRRVKTGKPRSWWLCRCDCGTEKIISGNVLSMGKSFSCGCTMYQRASVKRLAQGHGHSTPMSGTYRSWAQMIQRCTNPKLARYPDYGGRGIKVCDQWLDFEAFLRDMGARPDGKTIDRYPDKNGNYELGNCRWATVLEQNNNRRPRRAKQKEQQL